MPTNTSYLVLIQTLEYSAGILTEVFIKIDFEQKSAVDKNQDKVPSMLLLKHKYCSALMEDS